MWLDGAYLEGPVRIPFFTDSTRQLLQAPYHCYTGSSPKELQPNQPAQYCQINKDGIYEGDVQ